MNSFLHLMFFAFLYCFSLAGARFAHSETKTFDRRALSRFPLTICHDSQTGESPLAVAETARECERHMHTCAGCTGVQVFTDV